MPNYLNAKRGLATLFLLALCLAVSPSTATAQTALEPRNIVQLSASGTLEVAQDWISVSLTATKEASDPAVVQGSLRQITEVALNELKKSVQSGSIEVRTGTYSLQPRYSNDGKLNGWIGTSELVLEGSDFPRIGALASKVQHMTIGSLSFSLSRQARARLEGQAQSLAIESFQAKAGDIARSFGFKDYALREVSVSAADQNLFPRPHMVAMAARTMVADAAPVPLESGKSLVVVTVSGSVQLFK